MSIYSLVPEDFKTHILSLPAEKDDKGNTKYVTKYITRKEAQSLCEEMRRTSKLTHFIFEDSFFPKGKHGASLRKLESKEIKAKYSNYFSKQEEEIQRRREEEIQRERKEMNEYLEKNPKTKIILKKKAEEYIKKHSFIESLPESRKKSIINNQMRIELSKIKQKKHD